MLKEAKEYGDFLIVVVARDSTVCSVKGKKPLHSEQERLDAIEKTGLADKVRLGCIDDHYQAIAEEKPDIVALGYDQRAFVDNLSDAIESHVQIVRLVPFEPDKYKSSLMKE